MKAARLIVAICIVASWSCAHIPPQKTPTDAQQEPPAIPYEFGYVGNQGEQLTLFLQELEHRLRQAPGLAWSGENRQPPISPLNPDALMVFVKHSLLERDGVVRYVVEFKTVGGGNNPNPQMDGVVLGTSIGSCEQVQLSECLNAVVNGAREAGKKLPPRATNSKPAP
jgi:hypothetical protein